ncbi:MAG: MSCRAMM family protein [Pseudobacter sp.]|uniref:MSCRAMM family protein n=1 Tax=Pseudobacter sp. TaxID=2045420 RepID=UPI003F7FD7EA
MRTIITYLAIFCIAAACGKKEKDLGDVLNGNSNLSGQLLSINKFSGKADAQPMANRRVYLSFAPSDTTNFIYYVLTDAQGYFTFTRLSKEVDYALFVSDSIGKHKMVAYQEFRPPMDAITLLATNDTLRTSGIVLKVTDLNGDALNGAEVAIYNNEQIFTEDTAYSKYLSKLTSDELGRVIFPDLAADKYFFRGKISYGAKKLSGTATIDYSGKGLKEYLIQLQTPSAPAPEDTLTIKTIDDQGGILPNLSFCLFTNPALFNTTICDGNVYTGSTNTAGIKHLTELPAGTYYLLAQGTVQNIAYKGTAIFEWDAKSIKPVTVTLAKVIPVNSLTVLVRDSTDSPVNSTNLYLFRSKVLFLADTTTTSNGTGWIKNTVTDDDGKGIFRDLPEGTYYVRAKAIFGNLFLKGGDTVVLGAGGIESRLIQVKK